MTVLLVIIVIIAVLLVILCVNASRMKPTPIDGPLPASDAMGDDACVERFREMLKLPTVWGAENPNADHRPFDEFIPKMKELYPVAFEKLELIGGFDTYGFMLKWKGTNSELAPVVLMAHHDVVVAPKEGWTHDPFAADVVDGKIYARGSVDTKCILGGLLEAANQLAGEGYVPPRDIYICSSCAEEDSGEATPQMVQWFKDKGLVPYFVLDEGGAIIDNPPLGVKNDFALIGVAEKGIVNAFLTVNSKGGHASTPSLEDSTGKLIKGLDDLQNNPAPAAISAPVEAMLKELAAYSGNFGLKIVFGNLWLFRPLVLKIMKGNSETAAMVRSTYALTELEGGQSVNVLPKQAKAGVNIRIDPSETVDSVIARLKTHFDDQTEIRIEHDNNPSPISPFDNDIFKYISKVTHSVYPDAGIAPYVQSSCSDSRHFHHDFCPNVYRFAGILFRADQRSRIHGQDENIDVDSYKRGVGFYTELIRHLDMLGK